MKLARHLASLALLGSVVACGSSDRPDSSEAGAGNPRPSSGSSTGSDLPPTDDVKTGACDEGESRDCRVWLPEVNGVKNCFVGVQVCVDELWSSCLSDEDAAALLDG